MQGGNERAVGSTRTARHREPPREEVRVPGPKNRSPGKRAGDGRKQADSCPRRRRLLVLRRVGGESGWVPRATAPAGLKAASSPPLPPTRLPCPRSLSPQPLWPLSLQPPPSQPPVPPRPDSPPLAKPDRAEPAADTRNQSPRPRPRLTLTGCPSQSTPTCPRPPPIPGRKLQTGALFDQWQPGVGLLGKSRPRFGMGRQTGQSKDKFWPDRQG